MRYVIPLTPEPQRFSIVLAGRELLYKDYITYNCKRCQY